MNKIQDKKKVIVLIKELLFFLKQMNGMLKLQWS